MKNNKLLFSMILCFSLIIGCDGNDTIDSSTQISSINENDDNNEMITITFKQYDSDFFLRDNKTVIVFYDELISTTVKEFEKGYFLSYKELDEISMSLNYVVPELNGDGYWSFTSFYYDKDSLEEGGVLRDVYLNEDLIVYYGIYG